MDRNVSALSRQLGISRVTIYKQMKRLNIDKKKLKDITETKWLTLLDSLEKLAEINKEKKQNQKSIMTTNNVAIDNLVYNFDKLSEIEADTLKERLKNAKEEYDFNKELIIMLQTEITQYIKKESKTTMATHNGTSSTIPSIASLEKYEKLNLALSKEISEIEKALDLTGGGVDPFD